MSHLPPEKQSTEHMEDTTINSINSIGLVYLSRGGLDAKKQWCVFSDDAILYAPCCSVYRFGRHRYTVAFILFPKALEPSI